MAEDGPQSRVWLVNAESITVERGARDAYQDALVEPFGAQVDLPSERPGQDSNLRPAA
jgi:hypothetical protein